MITAVVAGVTVLAAEEPHRELPVPPLALGLGAFAALVVLLLITLQFNRDR
jgi:hypothetical protein